MRTPRAPSNGPKRAPDFGPYKGTKMKTSFRQNLLATTLLVGASALATPAWAQENQTADPTASQPTGPVEAQPTPSVSAEGEAVDT